MNLRQRIIRDWNDYNKYFSFCEVWSLIKEPEDMPRFKFDFVEARMQDYYKYYISLFSDSPDIDLERKVIKNLPMDYPVEMRMRIVQNNLEQLPFLHGGGGISNDMPIGKVNERTKKCWEEFFSRNCAQLNEITDHWELVDNQVVVIILCLFILMHMHAGWDIAAAEGDENAISQMHEELKKASQRFYVHGFLCQALNPATASTEIVVSAQGTEPLILPAWSREVDTNYNLQIVRIRNMSDRTIKVYLGTDDSSLEPQYVRIRNMSDRTIKVYLGTDDSSLEPQYRRIPSGEWVFALRKRSCYLGFLPRYFINQRSSVAGNTELDHVVSTWLNRLADEEYAFVDWSDISAQEIADISVSGGNYCLLTKKKTLRSNLPNLDKKEGIIRVWLGGNSAIAIDLEGKLLLARNGEELKALDMPEGSVAVDACVYDDRYIWLDAKHCIHTDNPVLEKEMSSKPVRCVCVGSFGYACAAGHHVKIFDTDGKVIQTCKIGSVCEMSASGEKIIAYMENRGDVKILDVPGILKEKEINRIIAEEAAREALKQRRAKKFGANFEYERVGNVIRIIKYKGGSDCITIPKMVDDALVTMIGEGAFKNNEGLKQINIPSSVITIEDEAFMGCANLEKVKLTQGLSEIGAHAFKDCKSLGEIDLPQGMLKIGEGAFQYCISITKVNLPDGLESINNDLFSICENLVDVCFPENLKEIGAHAFKDCKNLSEIDLPQCVRIIGREAFCGCTNLAKVKLNQDLLEIDVQAFMDCKSLGEIDLPQSILRIGEGVFRGCSCMTKAILPDTRDIISRCMFYDCAKLVDIKWPKELKEIGGYAFRGCESLINLELPDGLKEIGEAAFIMCSGLQIIFLPDSLVELREKVFGNCNELRAVRIPSCLQNIGESAFHGCENLTDVQLPEGLQSIGALAFAWCGFSRIELPHSLQKIGKESFNHCEKLEYLRIPSGVNGIEDSAFGYCKSLKEVYIEHGMEYIESHAFGECPALEIVRIPSSVKRIGDNAIYRKQGLFSNKIRGITLKVDAGSYAEDYAKENKYKYEIFNA